MVQDGDFGTAARMVVTAMASAILTATLVIAIGQSMMDRAPVAPGDAQPALVQTSG